MARNQRSNHGGGKQRSTLSLMASDLGLHIVSSLVFFPLTPFLCAQVDIVEFGDEGNGLCATRAFFKGELALTVPLNVCIGVHTATANPSLAHLFSEDKLVRGMPNVLLALHLLQEIAAAGRSPWAPFLRILPTAFTTPLYATPAQLLRLKGSAVQAKVGCQAICLRPVSFR